MSPHSSVIAALLVLLLSAEVLAGSPPVTTRSTYQYNVDNELTAITTQVGDGEPTTVYLTWDNFVPDAGDPVSGTVSAGNGRLIGIGPTPGSASVSERFEFDRRDRLTGYSGSAGSVEYGFHPTQMMAWAAVDGGAQRRFYYQNSANPICTNIHETDTGLWSAYLEEVRYLSDGGEQVLIQPRKDVACVYEPQAGSVTPYTTDPYGASSESHEAQSGGLEENPYRYAREYRDPVWGGYYLRARWYDPDLPLFISRDPKSDQVNRYAYASANPVMNVDPSGLASKSLGKGLKNLNKGVGGHFARVLLSPFLGVLEIGAHPKGFWKQIKNNTDGIDYFLAAGVVAAFAVPAGSFLSSSFSEYVASFSLAQRFGAVLATDAVLGLGQSAASAGLARGFKHFNWSTFAQGAEYTVGGIAWTRLGAGAGFKPFNRNADGLVDFLYKSSRDLDSTDVFIFRERSAGLRVGSRTFRFTSPWQEAKNIGFYHERLVAIADAGRVYVSEFQAGIAGRVYGVEEYVSAARRGRSDFAYVGVKKNFNAGEFIGSNPRNLPTEDEFTSRIFDEGRTRFSMWTNNCQYHSAAVRDELGLD